MFATQKLHPFQNIDALASLTAAAWGRHGERRLRHRRGKLRNLHLHLHHLVDGDRHPHQSKDGFP